MVVKQCNSGRSNDSNNMADVVHPNSFILAILMLHRTYLFNGQEVRFNPNILDSMLFRMQLGPPEVGLKTSELNSAITYTALHGLLSSPRYWHRTSKKLYC